VKAISRPSLDLANFYEKALFVKTDVALALCGRERNGFLPFALCFYSL
jgi:hypothetical protein